MTSLLSIGRILPKSISLTEQYLEIQAQTSQKYGQRSVVLMQVGSFHELYSIYNDHEIIGCAPEVADLLNIQLTRKNKMILENSRSNPLMAGFPSPCLDKYTSILLESGYTVVLIDQTTSPPDPDRAITKILSPSMGIDTVKGEDQTTLMTLYIEQQKRDYLVGKVVADLSTGRLSIHSFSFGRSEEELFRQTLSGWIGQDQPREIVWVSSSLDASLLPYTGPVHTPPVLKEYEKISYQNTFLKKIYKETGFLTPVEYLGLETSPHLVLSILYAFQFIYEHDPSIIERLRPPTHSRETETVELYNESLRQLQVFSGNGQSRSKAFGRNANGSFVSLECVFDVVDATRTPMGHRELRRRLSEPSSIAPVLEARWDRVGEWIERGPDQQRETQMILRGIKDMERLYRKAQLGRMGPNEIASWCLSWRAVLELVDAEIVSLPDGLNREQILGLLCRIDTDRLGQCSNTRWMPYLSVEGNGLEWREHASQEKESFESTERWIRGWEKELIGESNKKSKKKKDEAPEIEGWIRREWVCERNQNLPDAIAYTMTPKRASVLAGLLEKAGEKGVSIEKYNTSLYQIQCESLKETTLRWLEHYRWLYKAFDQHLSKWIEDWLVYETPILQMLERIVELDIAVSSASTAHKFGYSRPVIEKREGGWVSLSEVRHPLVERFEFGGKYVPHSVELGSGAPAQGLILTGLNSSGKTVLMKSIGLSVLMAQAGLYVPATYMKFSPFRKIFSRISGEDNLLASRSSFAVEMLELRSILQHADSYSLLLGDELCRGTEQESALSIVATTLDWWLEKRIPFVTATHLYPLFTMRGFTPDDWRERRLCVAHLWVEMNRESPTTPLIYHRQLREGLGETLYGLEVAQHFIQNNEWNRRANLYRAEILKQHAQLLLPKTSSYHPHLYVECCAYCQKTAKEAGHLHTHHLDYQCTFEKGQKERRDDLRNLIVLCEEHHRAVHDYKLLVSKRVQLDGSGEWEFVEV